MNYVGKMWRPPSEANSLIVQVTVGCSHNKCKFCNMYKEKDFYIKEMNEINQDINQALKRYSNYKRVFLADGDPLVMKTNDLLEIINTLNNQMPNLERVSGYATPKSILRKKLADLKKLKENGLEMVYLGVESGSKKVLEKIEKGATPEEIIEAGNKLKEAGIKNSTTIILGLGGKSYSKIHARETAQLISQVEPDYLSALTLMVKEDAPLYQDIEKDDFKLLNPYEILNELYEIMKDIDVDRKCIFRSNHASNYYSIKGTLPGDKEEMVKKLKYILKNPDKYHLKNEDMRRL